MAPSVETEDVPHVVQTRRVRGARAATNRAARSAHARTSRDDVFVRELDALAGPGEYHRVIADDVAAAGGEPDRARLALADHTVAREHAVLVFKSRPAPRAASPSCSAVPRASTLCRWWHFDDLDVVVAEALRGKRDQLEQHVDSTLIFGA
jgi:hypothetical protein